MISTICKSRNCIFKTIVLLIVLFLLWFMIMPMDSYGNTKALFDKKMVRVGYYLYDSYQEVDSNGVYSGYGYDYLKEISEFANWEYEFVVLSFDDCIKMLEEGQLDIVGGVDKFAIDSHKLNFSQLSNRDSQLLLYTKTTNDCLYFEDFDAFNGLSVGVQSGDYSQQYLDDYCKKNNFKLKKKYYDTVEQMELALENNEIQLIFTSVITNPKHNKIVGRMDEIPLYYAVNKDNPELLAELDKSMKNIRNSNPSYDMQIQNKYFIKGNVAAPSFTKEELDYIKNTQTVKVSYDKGWQPIEYYDKETRDIKGVTKDLFELLSKYTGIKFEFVMADSLGEALDFVKTGKADMISLVSHNYNISDERGLYTSSICINASLVGVLAKDRPFDGVGQVAMAEDYYLDILRNYDVKTYPTVEACFEAVNSGEADATIANVYTANYYLANPKYVNLIRQDLIGYSEDLSLGVSKEENIELLNILNKGLHCISDMELSNIILQNYVVYEQPRFRKLYYSNPVLFLGIIIAAVMTIIGILIYMIMLKSKVNSTSLKMIEFLNIEKDRIESTLRADAEEDALTGLYNRRKIEREVKEFLLKISVENQMRAEGNMYALDEINAYVMIDLDGFKSVNDNYGHPEGDLLLKKIAQEMKLIAGEEHLVGRLGGDEFVFLFKNISGKAEANSFADKISKEIKAVAKGNERWKIITVSIGVTLFGYEVYSFKELYQRADKALYYAKQNGKNKIIFYEDIK